MITIATWNINSIKARLEVLSRWLEKNQPDFVLLQEIKSTNETFPVTEIKAMGYEAVFAGQPSYNGVAVLSKKPVELIANALPGDGTDTQARFLDVAYGEYRFINIYAPNGNPTGSEKFAYKLAWLKRLRAYTQDLLDKRVKFLITGDFNIIPTDQDAKQPGDWLGDALFQPESKAEWRSLLHTGLTDAYRAFHPQDQNAFTFWDYQAGAFQRDNGIRIDHFLLSPFLADRMQKVWIDKEPRGWDKPSDHTPVLLQLEI